MKLLRLISRGAAGGGALGLLLAATGCATTPPAATPPPSPAPGPAAVAPPTAAVGVEQAWQDAKLVASRAPGRIPVVGAGTSMEPVYGDNTMLVISPIAYNQLRPGMTVAYRNREGLRVVHELVEKLDDGWRVKGINNAQADPELVTRRNLIGVVYASFNYDDDTPPLGTK
ncbi:MAG TPA: hypothetical protein VMF63_08670 [Opitutaceae bacterium]|nr:hypothetical protein [Opitutaceae bacterium]